MVTVRNGARSNARPTTPQSESTYPIVIVYRDTHFRIEKPLQLHSGIWYTLCSAVARQANLYRTLTCRNKPTPDQARRALVRWIKTLPLDDLI